MSFVPVQELFRRQAEALPHHAAIDGPDGIATYAELAARADRTAAFLLARGAARQELVAVAAEQGTALVPTVRGILQAGCAFMPLDPHTPARRLAAMLAEAPPGWILVEAGVLPRLREALAGASLCAAALDREPVPAEIPADL